MTMLQTVRDAIAGSDASMEDLESLERMLDLEIARRESGQQGRDAGDTEGRDAGDPEGRDAGDAEGRDAGDPEGRDAGTPEGRDAGAGTREGDHGDDDDMDGDRGGPVLTRSQRRQLEREMAKRAREIVGESARYAGIQIIDHPVPSLARDGEAGLSIGNAFLGIVNRSAHSRRSAREIEFMERSETRVYGDETYGVIPFSLLDKITLERKIEASRRNNTTSTTNADGSAGGGIGVDVYVDETSQFIYDQAPALKYANLVYKNDGGKWNHPYGAVAPSPSWYAEGADVAEDNIRFLPLEREAHPLADRIDLSTNLTVMDQAGIESLVMQGVENLIRERLMRMACSAPFVGAAFANDANAPTGGIANAPINVTNYGANADAFQRDDVVGAESRLREGKAITAGGARVFWLLSSGAFNLMRNRLRGGAATDRYLAQPANLFEGRIDSESGYGLPYVVTTEFGRTGYVNPATVMDGARWFVIIWGGVEIFPFRDPRTLNIIYGARVHADVAFINAAGAETIRQGA